MAKDIFTIGHSTHSSEDFILLLKAYNIQTLIDVRSYPGSRYMPQFNKENMIVWTMDNGIKYMHIPKLGGRRRKLPDADPALINGWKHIAFRNYCAYTLTKEYEEAVEILAEIAQKERVCYMCAESVPWKCHRLLISNTLTLKGFCVHHIMTEAKTITHELNKYGAAAQIDNNRLIYPEQ